MTVEGWAVEPKTVVEAVEDEIAVWCRAREVAPFRLDVPERLRLADVLKMWGEE